MTTQKDRFGNVWEIITEYANDGGEYKIFSNRVGLYDGTYWHLRAYTADEAIDILIADGKYTP